jgi:pSer/pThr/pTyr-binding forkhead associated (FHA) protein
VKKCPKCSARNDDGAKICALCGVFFIKGDLSGSADLSHFEPRLMQGGKQTHRGEVRLGDTRRMGGDPNAASFPPLPSKEQQAPPQQAPPAAKATPADDPRVERHYVLPRFGDPVKLDKSVASFGLGRDRNNQILLPTMKASRTHAELRWKGSDLVVRDLNSQNGTFVDGNKLSAPHVLQDGEVMSFGDYDLIYRLVVPGEEVPNSSLDETWVGDSGIVKAPAAALEGDIAFMPVREIMKRLNALRASGTFTVEVKEAVGRVRLADGLIRECEYAGLTAEVALGAMTALTVGRFKFVLEPGTQLASPPRPGTPPPRG